MSLHRLWTTSARRCVANGLIRWPALSSFFSHPASTLPRQSLFEAVTSREPASTAIVHSLSGRLFAYGSLVGDVCRARDGLRAACGARQLTGQRVGLLMDNSYDYVVNLLAILAADAVAVPLSPNFPAPELQFILSHSDALLLVSSPQFRPKIREIFSQELSSPPLHLEVSSLEAGGPPEECVARGLEPDAAGIMLYTSGTTSRPKGVLIPLSALTAQCRILVEAWRFCPQDRVLHVLPLYHIHGLVTALLAPLFAGSTVEFLFPFAPEAVWNRLAAAVLTPVSPATREPVTFFTAVPTIYHRLLATVNDLDTNVRLAAAEALSPRMMRLAVSGSAALPTPLKKAWSVLSDENVLLERYGMTETGMVLSCGVDPADRVDGSVGWPLPGVEVRLVDSQSHQVIGLGDEIGPEGGERQGEIQVRGPALFKQYWSDRAASAAEFETAEDGGAAWFKTGDVAVRRDVQTAGHGGTQAWASGPMYFIQGRKSVDFIKTGGEKVSALEVERELLSLPEIAEAAVVAVPSSRWGHKVGAVVVLTSSARTAEKPWSAVGMRRSLRDRLASYKIPQLVRVVPQIPRNAMGKINKNHLVRDLFLVTTGSEETD